MPIDRTDAGSRALPAVIGAVALSGALAFSLPARAQENPFSALSVLSQPVAQPLSAIDWLDQGRGLAAPPFAEGALRLPSMVPPPLTEPPVVDSAQIPDVTVTPLEDAGLDAVGLLPSSVSGLPLSLWQGSRTSDLVALISEPGRLGLPAIQGLMYTLLLAEADAPPDAGRDSLLLQARVDALMRLGAVEPAQALLERAGPEAPALFSRWFDATMLTGAEDTACAALMRAPHLSPSYGAQVFCSARRGDWDGAMLTLDTARALGVLPEIEADLLARFMDPELLEDTELPRAPVRPSPLVFRLYEALGEPLITAPLPRAFAVADLRDTAGWRAQIEAAERLASSGALAPNRLLGLYSERKPAASGGVWDRVQAVQRFDAAIRSGDTDAIGASLPVVWSAMGAADLGVAFASLYSPALERVALQGAAGELAYRIALLGPDYEAAAIDKGDLYPGMRFATAVARGQVDGMQPEGALQVTIRDGFAAPTPPPAQVELLRAQRLGEAILQTIRMIQRATQGELVDLAGGIATLRAVGLEDTARRAALQLILLGPRS